MYRDVKPHFQPHPFRDFHLRYPTLLRHFGFHHSLDRRSQFFGRFRSQQVMDGASPYAPEGGAIKEGVHTCEDLGFIRPKVVEVSRAIGPNGGLGVRQHAEKCACIEGPIECERASFVLVLGVRCGAVRA